AELALARAELSLEVDRSVELAASEADVEVEPPARGDLLAPERPERAAVGAADELAAKVPVEERVLAVHGARLPPRSLGREQPARPLPVEEHLGGLRVAEGDQPGLVAQRLPNRDLLLPGLRELRPPPGNGIAERERAAVDQHEDAERRHRLRHRVDVD